MTSTPIHRAFFDLTDEEVEQAEQVALVRWHGFGKSCGWDELLKSRRILIFSEAQSGKTYECQAQRDAMWAVGEPAFYVELAAVGCQPWRELRTPEETDRLERWRRTEAEVATVFLDSLDELRLTQRSFQTALRNVASDLHGHMGRVRIVLTSRPLPVDRELFIRTFEAPGTPGSFGEDEFAAIALGKRPEEPKDRPKEVRFVSLLPLDQRDVAQLAAGRGVVDTEAFLVGLRASSMIEFMRRPQDVIEAAAAWIELGGRFGTHAEQEEFDIRARLKANPERAERPLEDARAMEGAKRLALAVTLTQRLTIRHDVNRDLGDPASVVDPAVVLGDWTEPDRRALLERGLFGFASYGRVRFHNRIAFEFLAAQRLADLMDAGLSRKTVRRILMVETAQGDEVIRPSLQDVAAWLSLRQRWVYDLVRERDPALLMNLGDPGSLSVEQRKAVLTALVDRFGKGGWRGLSVPGIQISRLAHSSLSAVVLAEFDLVENPEVQQVLLDLIAAARLADCAEIARRVLLDASSEHYVRSDALDALITLDDPALAIAADRAANRSDAWDHRFVRLVVFRLFPSHMSIDQLSSILAWIEETRSTGWELSRNLPPLIDGMSLDRIEELRAAVLPLVEEGFAFDPDLHAAVNARPHLIHLLAAICSSLLEAGRLPPEHAEGVALVAQLARGIRSDDKVPLRLFDAIASAPPAIRAAVFARDVALTRRARPFGKRLDLFMELAWRGTLRWQATDEAWVRDVLADVGSGADLRAAALQVEIFAVAPERPEPVPHLEALGPLVADDEELARHLEQRLQPRVVSRQERRWAVCDLRRRRQRERREAKDKASWVMFWRELKDDPEAAFSAERAESTAWNLYRVMGRGGHMSRATGWDRRLIEDHLGREVADRLRAALLPMWRRESPPMPSERPADERGTFWERWVLALTAIAAEAEDPSWAERLRPEEAETAVRYAQWHWSNFPVWLDALAKAHPSVVDRILGAELSWSLGSPATAQARSMTLQDIEHATTELAALFLPRLRAWLRANGGLAREEDDPAGAAERLDQVVDVVMKHGDTADRTLLRDLAIAGLAAGGGEPFVRVWLPLLFATDPDAAVARLEGMLADIEVSRESRAVAWIAELFGGFRRGSGVGLRHPAMTPPLLLRLLRLAYRHVERDTDAVHDGSYQPDTRDDAETGRNMLLNAIMELPGSDGWAAKIEIANDPEFKHLRDRLRLLALERSAREADSVAMQPREVVKLDVRDEPGPRTPAEMFVLMRDRLEDLEDHLLQDESPREMWSSVEDERVMRRAIAEYLISAARGAYLVDQEQVTADEKETDIRFRSTVSGIEGVLELKIGDKDYSGTDLMRVIPDQLVAKYLAPADRRAGCVLITRSRRDCWQHHETSANLDFDGLIDLLQKQAIAIQKSFPAEIHIGAFGLDLTRRLGTEREAREARRAARAARNAV